MPNNIYYYGFSSTSDDEQVKKETGTEIPWQKIKKRERRKIHVINAEQITLSKKFSAFTEGKDNDGGE